MTRKLGAQEKSLVTSKRWAKEVPETETDKLVSVFPNYPLDLKRVFIDNPNSLHFPLKNIRENYRYLNA